MSDAEIASSAVVAALAASFQPANAATRTGERRSGGSPTHFKTSTSPRLPTSGPTRTSIASAIAVKIDAMEAAVAAVHPQVAELHPGQRFEGRYACLAKERLTSRTGTAYLSLRLRDRSGTIDARVFRDADRIGLRFDAGDAIAVRGRVERYRGELGGRGR